MGLKLACLLVSVAVGEVAGSQENEGTVFLRDTVRN